MRKSAVRTCVLSNGVYSVMLSDSGSGFSRWRELSVTRWREDFTRDDWGTYLLLRDEESGAVWSATRQPFGDTSADIAFTFTDGRAEFVKRDVTLDTTLEIAVASEADVELRRLTISNRGDKSRTLSVTSYAELVLGPGGADNAHPAFSKMFVQTSTDAGAGLLLATRRRRSNTGKYGHARGCKLKDGQPAARSNTKPIGRVSSAGAARRDYADGMRNALESAWDGQWYRRGFYDDGTPLGSHESEECQIDAIAQSWSVLAGAANPQHAAQAMISVDRILVDHQHQVARLFTPPFDHGAENPGYIKGYPPGVRENGGQYTHGAIWSIFAWARLGDGDRAGALFDILNPINHTGSAEAVEQYKVEPYVACADVYSVAPYIGHGGWTWYTGSAAWLYRAGLEAVLGFQLRGDQLRMDPCIPKHWPAFQLTYQTRTRQNLVTRYEIAVENPGHVCHGVVVVELDGKALTGSDAITLAHDGRTHSVRIVLGEITATRMPR